MCLLYFASEKKNLLQEERGGFLSKDDSVIFRKTGKGVGLAGTVFDCLKNLSGY